MTGETKTFEVVKKQNQSDEIQKIIDLIKSTKFGSVTIYIENGKIIQADRNEKLRFK